MLAIYTRLSKEDTDSTSIQNQLREGKEFAKSQNLEYKIYNEGEGVSGGLSISERPIFNQLYEDILTKKVKVVWFRNENRMTRNKDVHGKFVVACIKSKTKIFFGAKEFDYLDPTQSLTGTILSAINSYSLELQSLQTKKALLDNIKEGKAWSVLPYGYSTDKDKYLVVSELEAENVRQIYTDHSNGKGARSIAEELSSKGVKTRKGKSRWSDKAIQDILKNPIYKGKRRWQDKLYDAPRIVSDELWQKSMDAFETNKNNRGKKVTHKYLLKGLLKCGKCGRNMYGRRRVSGKDNYYMCSSKRYKELNCGTRGLNIDALEDFIWNRFFVEEAFIELVKKWANNSQDKSKRDSISNELEALQKELSQYNKDKSNAVKLAIKGILKEEDVEGELKNIEEKIGDIELKIKKLNEELDYINQASSKQSEIENDIKTLKKETPFNVKREIINKYIKWIAIKSVEREHVLWIDFHLPIKTEVYLRWKGTFYSLNELPDTVSGAFDKEGIVFLK